MQNKIHSNGGSIIKHNNNKADRMDERQQQIEQLIGLYREMTPNQRHEFDERAMSVIALLDDAKRLRYEGGKERGGGVA